MKIEPINDHYAPTSCLAEAQGTTIRMNMISILSEISHWLWCQENRLQNKFTITSELWCEFEHWDSEFYFPFLQRDFSIHLKPINYLLWLESSIEFGIFQVIFAFCSTLYGWNCENTCNVDTSKICKYGGTGRWPLAPSFSESGISCAILLSSYEAKYENNTIHFCLHWLCVPTYALAITQYVNRKCRG